MDALSLENWKLDEFSVVNYKNYWRIIGRLYSKFLTTFIFPTFINRIIIILLINFNFDITNQYN